MADYPDLTIPPVTQPVTTPMPLTPPPSFDWSNALGALSLGLGAAAGRFGESPTLSRAVAENMQQRQLHQQEQQGFQQASQAISWANQNAKGDPVKEMTLLNQYLQESGVQSPVALKILSGRVTALEPEARKRQMATEETGGFNALMAGQPQQGLTPPSAQSAAPVAPAPRQDAQGPPSPLEDFAAPGTPVLAETPSGPPPGTTPGALPPTYMGMAKEDFVNLATRRLGWTNDQANRVATLNGLKSKYEIPYKAAETQAVGMAGIPVGVAKIAAETPGLVERAGQEATQAGQIKSAQEVIDTTPTGQLATNIRQNADIQAITKAQIALDADINKAKSKPLQDALRQNAVDLQTAEMPVKARLVEMNKLAAMAVSGAEPFKMPGLVTLDRSTEMPTVITKEQSRDPALNQKYAFISQPQVIQLQRINEGLKVSEMVMALSQQMAASGPGSSTANAAAVRLKQYFGTGPGKMLLQASTDAALAMSPALTGSVRINDQIFQKAFAAAPTAADTPAVWQNWANTYRYVLTAAKNNVLQKSNADLMPPMPVGAGGVQLRTGEKVEW